MRVTRLKKQAGFPSLIRGGVKKSCSFGWCIPQSRSRILPKLLSVCTRSQADSLFLITLDKSENHIYFKFYVFFKRYECTIFFGPVPRVFRNGNPDSNE